MADNYLITGYWGEPHVTAENDRGFNAAVFGAGRFVLPVGEMFRAEYIGNNTVRVYDGKLLDGGALAGIPAGKHIDFLIPEAGQGMNRNDLIIFEYSQDASTLIESGVFKVVSGVETSENAADPVLYEEDLLTDEATLDQMALLRVRVSGAVISEPEIVFTTKYAGERIVDIKHGGTNATTAAEARKNLGIVSNANNLLVNSDFSNPVCSGTSGTSSYTLSEWTAHNLTITQETNNIKTVPTATYAYIKQVVKVTPGKTYTCAARFSNAGVGEIRIYDTAISTQYGKVGKVSVVGVVSLTVPDGVREIAVLLYPNAANVNSGIVYWAALYEGEYTAENLPEYQPRGYSLEAAVCGSGSLNFNVVGGVTQPTNPAENTIWVNTDTEITSWVFSATEPEAPSEGMVWISTGTANTAPFNALKDNIIMVYPISAKQYTDGAWADKSAKSYQNGAWVEWLPEGALYWRGNECENITGGWTSKAWQMQSDAGTTAQTFEIARNADHLMFTKTGQVGAVMYATNPVDLTNVNAIHFKGEMSAASKANWVAFHVWTKITGSYWATNSVATVTTTTSAAKTEFTLDVSALSGNHYIGFGIYDANCYVKLEELYLEVV